MAELFHKEDPQNPQLICWDRKNFPNYDDQLEAYKDSRTVYVGNLSFYTKETQILATFSTVGPVKRIIMGLNQHTNTPCGFCFVEYYEQEHAYAALKVLNESVCDDRVIRVDADSGFIQGRQYGRGKLGGQRRDDFRKHQFDPARPRPAEFQFQNRTKRYSFSGGSGRVGGRGGDRGGREEAQSFSGKKRGRDDDDNEDDYPDRRRHSTGGYQDRGYNNHRQQGGNYRGGHNNNRFSGGGGGRNFNNNYRGNGGGYRHSHGGGRGRFNEHDER